MPEPRRHRRWWLGLAAVLAMASASACSRGNPLYNVAEDGADSSGAADGSVGPDSSGPADATGPSSGDGTGGGGNGPGGLDGSAGDDADDDDGEPLCGDGFTEGDELCDDGNTDDTDGCTILCEPPRCDDGLLSGLETDVDCGGPECDLCPIGGHCFEWLDCVDGLLCGDDTGTCDWPASCLEHLFLDPLAPSGSYEIDPEGDGKLITVQCEMDYDGGGWTEILITEFDEVDSEWDPFWTYGCGPHTGLGFLGDGEDAVRDFDLMGIPHTQTWLFVDYIMIDYWEAGESAYLRLDGVEVASSVYPSGFNQGNICQYGGDEWYAQLFSVARHNTDTAEVVIGSTLDEPIEDEAFVVTYFRFHIR